MTTVSAIYRFWLPLVLSLGMLGACQRSTYQFQSRSASTSDPAVLQTQVLESAVVVAVAPPNAQTQESYLQKRPSTRRPARRRPILRILRAKSAPLVATMQAASAAVRVAAPASRLHQQPGQAAKPVRYRSRGIALLLAILSVTYLPLSLHNFYLGYYGRGVLAIALLLVGVFLLELGILGTIFSGGSLLGVGLIGAAILAGWFVWQLSDLVRIILKDLTPKNGEYSPRLFQIHPDALVAPPTD